MVCLAEKIDDRARRHGRDGACCGASAPRQRKMANAAFALHGKKVCSRAGRAWRAFAMSAATVRTTTGRRLRFQL